LISSGRDRADSTDKRIKVVKKWLDLGHEQSKPSPMSHQMHALTEELRRLRRAGTEDVFVSDSTWQQLEELANRSDEASRAKPVRPVGATGSSPAATARGRRTTQDQSVDSGPPSGGSPFPDPPVLDLPAELNPAEKLAWLRRQLEGCEVSRAQLNPGGQLVFGSGPADASIFFCGEAPGADEERSGQPFVGKAGQLLTKIITAMGLTRDDVYLANILKWRPRHDQPHGNRPPTLEEMSFSLPYLRAQIEIVRPKVIVALGNSALTGLLGPDPKRKLGAVRGTWAEFAKVPVMITFHPAYVIRNGTLRTKRMIWEDMLHVMERCQYPISPKQRSFFLPKS
jgi:DNA polymerase